MKEAIIDLLADILEGKLEREAIAGALEIPPSDELGDYAFPCFPLARIYRKNPALIAAELSERLAGVSPVEKTEAVSGYLNIFVDKQAQAQQVLNQALDNAFGQGHGDETVVIEFCSPNTNKPLHLGHLRNMAIGESVARLLEKQGHRIVRTCVYNDRGVHICKSMLAYQRWGERKTPKDEDQKPDHFVGDYYVLFDQWAKKDASLDEQVQQMLRDWEAGDEEVLKLWRRMNRWAFAGYKDTFETFGTVFDKEYYESQIYQGGKEIVTRGLERGVFVRRDDGAIAVDLEGRLGEKVLLRSDGTSLYIVQDLHLAALKKKEFNFDRSIYVVGNEQDYHFDVLIAIYQKLDMDIGQQLHHLSYGMVELPEGKMKSREGTVVDADDLIADTAALAREEIERRFDLPQEELDGRARKIGLAAIKYQFLKIDAARNMLFNPSEAIRFEGNTGPYLLYSYARAGAILRQGGPGEATDLPPTNAHEDRLLKKIGLFPEVAAVAAEKLAPSLMAAFAFELGQTFNEFYHQCPVLKSDNPAFRLALVRAFRETLGKCLDLLDIERIEAM